MEELLRKLEKLLRLPLHAKSIQVDSIYLDDDANLVAKNVTITKEYNVIGNDGCFIWLSIEYYVHLCLGYTPQSKAVSVDLYAYDDPHKLGHEEHLIFWSNYYSDKDIREVSLLLAEQLA